MQIGFTVSTLVSSLKFRTCAKSLHASMQHRFKGMRKGEMSMENLLHTYESELTTL